MSGKPRESRPSVRARAPDRAPVTAPPGRAAQRLPQTLLPYLGVAVLVLFVANATALLILRRGRPQPQEPAEGAAGAPPTRPEPDGRKDTAPERGEHRGPDDPAPSDLAGNRPYPSPPDPGPDHPEGQWELRLLSRGEAGDVRRETVQPSRETPTEPSPPTPTRPEPDGEPREQAKGMRLVRLASQDADRARRFQKRTAVFPRKQDTKTGGASYPPKPCDGFLDPPKELSEFLALREENKALLVTHRGNNPVKTELLRCTLDSGDGFAVTPRNARAATEYAARIKYLVLEAVSLADKVVHRYQHRCEPVTKVLPLKYGGDGAAVPVETSFAYPWPEALAVNCKDLNGGKPFPLFPKGGALSMGSDIASTDRAETKVRSASGRRLREITLKRPVPRVAGEIFQLLLRFSPPGAADGETRGAQGDSGAGGGSQIRVSLSAPDLRRYFAAINAEKPDESWAALREGLDELMKLKQEAEKLLGGPTEGRRERERVRRKRLEDRKRELEGYVASHKRASEIGERLGPIVNRWGEIDKRWHAIEKEIRENPENEELRKEQAALRNEELRLAREKDKEVGYLLSLMNGLPKEVRNAKALERKAKEAAAALPEIERSLQGIRGELDKLDREIEEKKKDISKRKADCERERTRLRDVPARCSQDVAPVEILDPWGRVLWVFVPRLERAR